MTLNELTELDLFVGFIIGQFQYELPTFAGKLTASDVNISEAIFVKEFKWRLTKILFKSDEIIESSDKQLIRALL